MRICVNPEHMRLMTAAVRDPHAYVAGKFNDRYVPEPNSGCWLWTGPRHPESGYGALSVRPCGGEWAGDWPAHRLAYSLFVLGTPLRRGLLQVCHRCDTRSCVNPDHLFLGTALDNERDKIAKGRRARFAWAEKMARGERAGQAKLRNADISVIRARRAAGETQQAIARDYGVTQAAISCIVRGRTWQHV